jgi:hypothetical protein
VGNPEGKRPLGRPRRRWVNNIKMNLRDIGWDDMDWLYLAQDRDQWRALVNIILYFSSCERGNEPSDSVKRWEFLE